MGALLGLASLGALSLFLARFLKRPAALMPLLAASAAMLWFTLLGCFGLLPLAGWLWYLGCAAALGYAIFKERGALLRRLDAGLVFFLVGGAFFILLYAATRPMLTQWDEFTFWGMAGKAVSETGEMYTVASSNLRPRAYPPGLIMFSYMMQFFGGFAEHKFIAAFAVLYLAALAAPAALWKKNRAGAAVFLAGMVLLPFLFETRVPAGQLSWSYLSCMADPVALGVFFGGTLCFYLAGGKKDERLLLPFGLLLAALVNLKDIGLALALIALFIAVLDLVFCERDRLSFFGLTKWKGVLAAGGTGFLCIALSYGGWALHQHLAVGQNRFNVGARGETLGQLGMLLAGVKALFGMEQTEQYRMVAPRMARALAGGEHPVSLLGAGVRVLALILVLALMAWLLAATRRERRRVLVFTLGTALCFAAFYIFNIFTYSFIFSWREAAILKDYHRYIAPFWMAWLMGTLALLAAQAVPEEEENTASARRLARGRTARAVSAAFTCITLVVVLAGTNLQANFLRISPSLYTHRRDVQASVNMAAADGMRPEDEVYFVSQGDDASRFYMFGYEMSAGLGFLYGGPLVDENGVPVLDEAGRPVLRSTTAASLVAPGGEPSMYPEPVPCAPEDLAEFLRQGGYTHLLLDRLDAYFVEAFGPLFADGLPGWTPDGAFAGGRNYYRIEWRADGLRFVPEEGGRSE